MIERKPSRAKVKSTQALDTGRDRYAVFRQHMPLVGPVTASAVSAVMEACSLSERQVRRLADRFRENPVAASLAPAPRGPQTGSHRMLPEIRDAIERLLREISLTKTPSPDASTAQQIHGLLIADNGDYRFAIGDVPSRRVIVRLIGEISNPQRAKSSMGSKSRTAHEPHPGAYESGGLLDVVQMDHTRADVILVDSIDREELTRPWITLIIDIWTRVILGFYVSFGDPSKFRCGRAVANAILPKEPLLRQLGVDVEYPMYGQFKRLHADHAAPHRAESFRRACLANGTDPDVRPRGPAHFGGHIERLIGTMIGKMRLLPGATGSNVTQRDGYDAGAAAALTIEEFERWLVLQIGIYHNTPHSALDGRCPAQVWAEATSESEPLISPGLDAEHLMRQFLPADEYTVRSSGIHILHRRYWHPELKTRIGLKVMIHSDERTLQEVYADIDGQFVPLSVVGHYPDVTEPEWEAARKRLRGEGAAYQADGAMAATARYIHAARQEVLTAKERTRQSKQQRKRQEREGTSHGKVAKPRVETQPAVWLPVAELEDKGWLKWLN
jgi:putative transposase